MVGIVLVGHCNLAHEFHKIIKTIVGDVNHICPVSFDPEEPPEDSINRVSDAIRKVDTGEGVIVLTDMFGGTPSNMSLSFLDAGKVEVLTGVNLPMLIRIITLRDNGRNIADLAKYLKSYGRKNICIATEILGKQKPLDT